MRRCCSLLLTTCCCEGARAISSARGGPAAISCLTAPAATTCCAVLRRPAQVHATSLHPHFAATHLFEEGGTLQQAARLARNFLSNCFNAAIQA